MKHTRLDPYEEYTSDEIEEAIRLWIHKERDRRVLRLKLLKCLTYEEVAVEVDMSWKGVQKIVYRSEDKLFRHLRKLRE